MNEIKAKQEDTPEIDALSKPLFIPNDANQSIKYKSMSSIFSEDSKKIVEK